MIKVKLFIKNYIILLSITIIFALLYTIVVPNYNDWIGIKKEDDITFCDKFINRLYFSLATTSTVGYGDVVPLTKNGRFISMIQMGILLSQVFIFVILHNII